MSVALPLSTWSSEFALIAADATIGTSAFCVSKRNVQTSGTRKVMSVHGSRIYDLCKGHTTASEEEKAKYAMITFDQYNALIRNWEQVADNYSGGVVGSGHIFMSNHTDLTSLTSSLSGTISNCGTKLDDAFTPLKH